MIDKVFEYKKLNDFNDVIDCYKELIVKTKEMRPTQHISRALLFGDIKSKYSYNRFRLNSIGVNIAQNFDCIEKNHPENIDELILQELDRLLPPPLDDTEKMIWRNLDRILEVDPENWKEAMAEGLKELTPVGTERLMNKQSGEVLILSLKKIMADNNLTPFETLKQIRNALLHGSYSIITKTDENAVVWYDKRNENEIKFISWPEAIKMQSPKMSGALPLNGVLLLLDSIYYDIRDKWTVGKREITLSDRRYVYCQNEYNLKKYIDSMQGYCIIPKENQENGNIKELIRRFPECETMLLNMQKANGTSYFEMKEVPEEEMKKRRRDFETFIRYCGKDKWKNVIDTGIYNDLFMDFFNSKYNDTIVTTSLVNEYLRFSEKFRYIILPLIAGKSSLDLDLETIMQVKVNTAKVSYKGHLIYIDALLGALNYACGYLKANSVESDNLFEYHNLQGMENLVVLADNDEDKAIKHNVSGVEKQRRIDSAIDKYQNQLSRINRDIRNTNKQLENLNEKNPNKEKLEVEFRKRLEESIAKKPEVMKQIFKLSVRRDEYDKDYIDYSTLFRHLRNSIAHARYTVDWGEALKSNNLEKIRFTFLDYNEDNAEKVQPDFKIELTAYKIEKIIDAVQTRVNDQLKKEEQMDKITETKLYFSEKTGEVTTEKQNAHEELEEK
jgi:hypothetical protein